MSGLYIHIPFCRSKCAYCDFTSYAGKEELIDSYLDALKKEAAAYASALGGRGGFNTLYIGGGTPSLLSPPQLDTLLTTVEKGFGPIKEMKEASFEANPESLTPQKAALLKAAGINRISLGLQASQNALLKTLGRAASFEDFLKVFGFLRSAGFDNINVDLMTGLPGQTPEDFRQSLNEVLKLEPEHLSFYALEAHEGTVFAKRGIMEEPDKAALMYDEALSALKKTGFAHYEISNFARPGKESLHNLNYWEQGDYIGLGAAAASHLSGRRWGNTRDMDVYLRTAGDPGGPAKEYCENLTSSQRKAERVMLGLRKTGGVELEDDIITEFKRKIETLRSKGLLETEGRRIKINKEYLYLANAVFREFL